MRSIGRLGAVLVTLVLGAVAAEPVGAQRVDPVHASAHAHTVAAAAAALPTCRYRDELTRYRKLGQWRKTLLDTNLKVASAYKPTDLVSVSRAGIAGSRCRPSPRTPVSPPPWWEPRAGTIIASSTVRTSP